MASEPDARWRARDSSCTELVHIAPNSGRAEASGHLSWLRKPLMDRCLGVPDVTGTTPANAEDIRARITGRDENNDFVQEIVTRQEGQNGGNREAAQRAVSRALRTMRARGQVVSQREGRAMRYRLSEHAPEEAPREPEAPS